MKILELQKSLAYVFEMVPTNVRIVSDEDAEHVNRNIIDVFVDHSSNDQITAKVVNRILQITRSPTDIILIDIVRFDDFSKITFVIMW